MRIAAVDEAKGPTLATPDAGPDAMLVADYSPHAFATRLLSLVLDPALREWWGRRSREAAERYFNVAVTAPALARVFSEAIEAFAVTRRPPKSY